MSELSHLPGQPDALQKVRLSHHLQRDRTHSDQQELSCRHHETGTQAEIKLQVQGTGITPGASRWRLASSRRSAQERDHPQMGPKFFVWQAHLEDAGIIGYDKIPTRSKRFCVRIVPDRMQDARKLMAQLAVSYTHLRAHET